eukprot:scaffold1052_cov339-Pavlova_lutheri.AAC.3
MLANFAFVQVHGDGGVIDGSTIGSLRVLMSCLIRGGKDALPKIVEPLGKTRLADLVDLRIDLEELSPCFSCVALVLEIGHYVGVSGACYATPWRVIAIRPWEERVNPPPFHPGEKKLSVPPSTRPFPSAGSGHSAPVAVGLGRPCDILGSGTSVDPRGQGRGRKGRGTRPQTGLEPKGRGGGRSDERTRGTRAGTPEDGRKRTGTALTDAGSFSQVEPSQWDEQKG